MLELNRIITLYEAQLSRVFSLLDTLDTCKDECREDLEQMLKEAQLECRKLDGLRNKALAKTM